MRNILGTYWIRTIKASVLLVWSALEDFVAGITNQFTICKNKKNLYEQGE